MDKVAIIGLGYVGLPTACLAATVSFDTLGYDTNIELIKELIQGSIRIKDQTVQNLFLEAQKTRLAKGALPSDAKYALQKEDWHEQMLAEE